MKNQKKKVLPSLVNLNKPYQMVILNYENYWATFRLTVQEANLQVALEQVIESLRSQTKMQMTVECSLPSQSLNPQELVHVLQIVREATLNAIKHSKGTRIEVKSPY